MEEDEGGDWAGGLAGVGAARVVVLLRRAAEMMKRDNIFDVVFGI